MVYYVFYSWSSYMGLYYGVSYGFYCGAYSGVYIISLNESFKYLSSGVFNYKLSKCSPNMKYNESVS